MPDAADDDLDSTVVQQESKSDDDEAQSVAQESKSDDDEAQSVAQPAPRGPKLHIIFPSSSSSSDDGIEQSGNDSGGNSGGGNDDEDEAEKPDGDDEEEEEDDDDDYREEEDDKDQKGAKSYRAKRSAYVGRGNVQAVREARKKAGLSEAFPRGDPLISDFAAYLRTSGCAPKDVANKVNVT